MSERASYRLIQGDCLDVLPTLADASVDAIVTDPPYALTSGNGKGFMGKEWDGAIPGIPFWREMLRVAKPGVHLLAFGGTRTHHRLMCAIEDAGWEIRDVLTWIYGSGFPKSLDISKAIEKRRDDVLDVEKVRLWLNEKREQVGLTLAEVNRHFGHASNGGGSASSWMTNPTSIQCPTWDQWLELKSLLGFGDEMDAEVWRLDDRKGKPGDDWEKREVLGEKSRNGKPPQYMWGETDGQNWNETAPATEAAKQWQGWGTALKPAHEPIILARKPLDGTVAANVLAHGVGGIHVDACRVEVSGGLAKGGPPNGWRSPCFGDNDSRLERSAEHPAGRWPANLVLTHHPDCRPCGTRRVKGSHNNGQNVHNAGINYHGGCLPDRVETPGYADADGFEEVAAWQCHEQCPIRLLDDQAGERPGDSPNRKPRVNRNGLWRHGIYNAWNPLEPCETPGYKDQVSGPSRFFPSFAWSDEDFVPFLYVPKASRRERNAGLEGMPEKCPWTDFDGPYAEGRNPKTGERTGEYKREQSNHHPTVKPIQLCRWLTRLICPPGGTVLDPFAGSGSIGVAALREGFGYLGIEMEPDYHAIAARRLDAEAGRLPLPLRHESNGYATVVPAPMPSITRRKRGSEPNGYPLFAGMEDSCGDSAIG